jgi:hypothetical protein
MQFSTVFTILALALGLSAAASPEPKANCGAVMSYNACHSSCPGRCVQKGEMARTQVTCRC